MNLSGTTKIVLPLVLMLAATYWLGTKLDLAQTWAVITSTPIIPLLGTIPLILLSHLLRSYRWIRILAPVTGKIGLWPAFSAVMVGYGTSVIIPRSGEIIRPWILSRHTGKPLPQLLSSILIERILDVVSLLVVICILLSIRYEQISTSIPWMTPKALLLGIALPVGLLCILIGLIAYTTFARNIALRLEVSIPRVGKPVRSIVDSIQQSVKEFVRPSSWPMLILTSAGIWILYAMPILVIIKALPWAGAEAIGFVDVLLVLVMIAVGVAIAPTPGAIGVYQGFASAALEQLFNAPINVAAAFSALAWVINYGVAFIGGCICYAWEVYNDPKLTFTSTRNVLKSK